MALRALGLDEAALGGLDLGPGLLDALVILEEPTFPGCWITARPVGVFWMEDDKGPDAKIICVPADDPRWGHIKDIGELPEHLTDEIEHFFDVYKMLEADKFSNTRGYEGTTAAWTEIEAALARYPGPPSH